MQITKKWLLDHRTNKNAWTKKQAAILGMEWPLKKGWMQMVIGREIDYKTMRKFETAKNINAQTPLDKVINLYTLLSKEDKEKFKLWVK